MTKKLTLHWDNLDKETRWAILEPACIDSRMAYYEWMELEEFLRIIIKDNLSIRSKNTVEIEA